MIRFRAKWKGFSLEKLFHKSQYENELALKMAEDTEPYVPWQSGSLNTGTVVRGNQIIYGRDCDYANYVWEGVVMVDSATGRGASYIPNVGYRYRKGAKLVPSGRKLQYNHSLHPLATDHWFDHSEKDNGDKWAKYLEDMIGY